MKTESRPSARGDFGSELSEDFSPFSFVEEPEWDFDDAFLDDFAKETAGLETASKKARTYTIQYLLKIIETSLLINFPIV
jgi:hypothetical protein